MAGTIVAVAIALNAWKTDTKNLWLDESVSWSIAAMPLPELLETTAADIHPPGYYLALKAWTGVFGTSLWGLRSLSLAATVVSLVCVWRLASEALPFGAACGVLLWFGVSPHTVAYSQEARMYACATAAVLAACVAFRRWIDTRFTSRAALVAWTVCSAAGLYLHYFTALAIVATWAHVALLSSGRFEIGGRRIRIPWVPWIAANAGIVVLYAPWLVTALEQAHRGQPWRASVTVSRLPALLSYYFRAGFFGTYGTPAMASVAWTVAAVIVLGGLVAAILAVVRDRRAERPLFFVILATLPIAMGIGLLRLEGELDLTRYLGYATPLLILAAAVGLVARGVNARVVAGAMIIVAIASAPSLRAYYADPVKDYDARPLVSYLLANARHGPGAAQDPVIVAPGYLTSVLQYVSKDALTYSDVYSDQQLSRTLAEDAAGGRSVWVVVDYRWPGFAALPDGEPLTRLTMPWLPPNRLRLFRTGTTAAPHAGGMARDK